MRKIAALVLTVLTVFALSTESSALPKGAVLIDSENGRVLFEHNKDEKLPMASTTKIMTALIALEEENPDEYFTVNKADVIRTSIFFGPEDEFFGEEETQE